MAGGVETAVSVEADGEYATVPLRALFAGLITSREPEPFVQAGLVNVLRRQSRLLCQNTTPRDVMVTFSGIVSWASGDSIGSFNMTKIIAFTPGETKDLTFWFDHYCQSQGGLMGTSYLDGSSGPNAASQLHWRFFTPIFAGMAFGYASGEAEMLRKEEDGRMQIRASCQHRFDSLTLGFTDEAGARTVWARACSPDYANGRYLIWFEAPPELQLAGILRDVELMFGLADPDRT